MLQSYVTNRHTDVEKEYGAEPSQQMSERPRLFAHFQIFTSVTMAFNIRWHASPMMQYSREHFTSVKDTR
jgi:hypothetical protein